MLEDYEKKMSLLLDNELGVEEALDVLQQIEKSEELQLKWNRYNIGSSILKANIFPVTDLTSQLSQRLESEPIILMPQSLKPRLRRAKTITVAALAASVAAITVITIPKLEQSPVNESAVPTTVAKSPSPPIAPLPVVDSETTPMNPRFNRYLVSHSESTYKTGMQGILPYARVVSYEMSR